MVQKVLLTVLLASVAGPAFGADMPLKAPPRAIEQGATWTGFYLFGYGGYSWGKATPDAFDVGDAIDGLHNPKPKGAVFGFGGGYNWQYGRFVGGVEVDYGFSQEKDSQSVVIESGTCGELPCSLSAGLSSKIDALGSARVRAGFLLADSFLVYATGGLGFARSQATISETFTVGTQSETLSATAKATNFGWVAGGGIEWQLMQYLRLRGEYLHYDFGSTSYAFSPNFTIGGFNVNAKLTDDVVRGALIWNFN